MFKKSFLQKMFCLLFVVFTANAVLTSCGNDSLDGRYVPANSAMAMALPEITISGDNFTTKLPMIGTEVTAKFKYEDGKITFTEGGIPVPCEFKNGSLWYSGMEYKKAK